ncbi:MAG: NupC/NupG family nucleoside CNT transporter, partial [Bacteroidetes bacterium]|nr:NupC/NupG family nucleoside CNT transporter [Bacteroidota bacterium]
MDYARGALGILVIVLVAYLFSSNKKKIDWRLVAIGISLQLVFG